MQVKIGDKTYSAADQPIMLMLSPEDKANIASMAPEAAKYARFPDDVTADYMRAWMVTPEGKT